MITGQTLRDAILSGANNIANQRTRVDELNVFPVPDGDTGTNMSMTIGAARAELEAMPDSCTVAEASKTAASAMLRGARGNSGVITSLLFRGFSKALKDKTEASAADLAAALQQKKKRVLLIDMDGQANLTESCGLSIEEERTVYGAMKGEYTLPVFELENGLSVVPSCLDLSATESELINEPGRELILKGLIAKLLETRKFDYILIDCPPSLGLLTLNALTSADFLIIPVQAQFLAMRGMAKITNVVGIVKERLNPNLNIGGIVITQFDKRKTLNKSVAELISESFCDKVFKTVIRDNVSLAEAPIKGMNIFEYNKNSNGAKDYMELAKEVLKLK